MRVRFPLPAPKYLHFFQHEYRRILDTPAIFELALGSGLIGDIKVTLKFKTTGRGLRTKSKTGGKSEAQPSFFLRFQRQWPHRLRVCCAPFQDQAWAICCLIFYQGAQGTSFNLQMHLRVLRVLALQKHWCWTACDLGSDGSYRICDTPILLNAPSCWLTCRRIHRVGNFKGRA